MTNENDPDDNPWKTTGSRIVYENAWLRLREDSVIRPDGSPGIYSVLELPESVTIAAVDADDRVALVRQWRYTHRCQGLELPSGSSEKSDGTLLHAAQRELEEETGLRASSWTGLGTVQNSNGATTDVAHLFLAEDLTLASQVLDPSESDLRLIWLPVEQAIDQAYDGTISESTSVAVLLKLAYRRLGRH